jgi:hypothetical protein
MCFKMFQSGFIVGVTVLAAFGDAYTADWRSTGTCTVQVTFTLLADCQLGPALFR